MMNIKYVLKTYSLYAVIALFVVSSLGWYTTVLKLDTSKQDVKTQKALLEKSYADCKRASAEAQVKNLEEVRKIETENVKKVEVSDARLDALRKQYNANLLHYAANQNRGSTGEVRLTSITPIAASGYTRSDSTEIYISFEDAGICAENTARLKAVKEWADSLNSQ